MQSKEQAIRIIDQLIDQAHNSSFSYVGIKANTVSKILQEETGDANHAMPTCCLALRERFRNGKDFFRRGNDRMEWQTEINGAETSTFEVLFEIHR